MSSTMLSSSSRSLIPQEEKQRAKIIFEETDSYGSGYLSFLQFLQALKVYLGREVFPKDLPQRERKQFNEVEDYSQQKRISFIDFVRVAYFLQMKFQNRLSEKEEKFLLDNFSKREIKVFIQEWEAIDINSSGILPLHQAGNAIQAVLAHYLDSNANSSLFKQFYIEKAGRDVEYREYMHFITHFLHSKKYTFHSRKSSNTCGCSIF